MATGKLSIDLKGSQIVVEEPKNWIQKFARFFTGDKKVKRQVVTQLQSLENLYGVFTSLGWNNITYLEVNGNRVYDDEDYTEDDFKMALELAIKEESQSIYHIEFELQKIAGDDESYISVNMYSQGAEDERPLTIDVNLTDSAEATEKFLEYAKQKIDEKFGVESGDIEVDEDETEEIEIDDDLEQDETEEVEEAEPQEEEKAQE